MGGSVGFGGSHLREAAPRLAVLAAEHLASFPPRPPAGDVTDCPGVAAVDADRTARVADRTADDADFADFAAVVADCSAVDADRTAVDHRAGNAFLDGVELLDAAQFRNAEPVGRSPGSTSSDHLKSDLLPNALVRCVLG